MKISGSTLTTVALGATFFLSAFGYWIAAFTCLILIFPYYIYWVVSHDKLSDRLEALLNYVFIIITTISTFAVLYEKKGIICNGEAVNDSYHSIYFSIITWTTLGYGDCLPTNEIKHWAAAEALIGYVMMAVFIALLFKLFEREAPNKVLKK